MHRAVAARMRAARTGRMRPVQLNIEFVFD